MYTVRADTENRTLTVNTNAIKMDYLQQLILLDDRLMRLQPCPLRDLRWEVIVKNTTATYETYFKVIRDIENIDAVLQFVKKYRSAIVNKLGEDTEKCLEFMENSI